MDLISNLRLLNDIKSLPGCQDIYAILHINAENGDTVFECTTLNARLALVYSSQHSLLSHRQDFDPDYLVRGVHSPDDLSFCHAKLANGYRCFLRDPFTLTIVAPKLEMVLKDPWTAGKALYYGSFRYANNIAERVVDSIRTTCLALFEHRYGLQSDGAWPLVPRSSDHFFSGYVLPCVEQFCYFRGDIYFAAEDRLFSRVPAFYAKSALDSCLPPLNLEERKSCILDDLLRTVLGLRCFFESPFAEAFATRSHILNDAGRFRPIRYQDYVLSHSVDWDYDDDDDNEGHKQSVVEYMRRKFGAQEETVAAYLANSLFGGFVADGQVLLLPPSCREFMERVLRVFGKERVAWTRFALKCGGEPKKLTVVDNYRRWNENAYCSLQGRGLVLISRFPLDASLVYNVSLPAEEEEAMDDKWNAGFVRYLFARYRKDGALPADEHSDKGKLWKWIEARVKKGKGSVSLQTLFRAYKGKRGPLNCSRFMTLTKMLMEEKGIRVSTPRYGKRSFVLNYVMV